MSQTCIHCRFYRFKADHGPGPENEVGACDNPEIDNRVRIIGKSLVLSILRGAGVTEVVIEENAETIDLELDLRFRGDFGCILFQPAPGAVG